MRLTQLTTGHATLSLEKLSRDVALAKEIQTRLITLGCLDPKADGRFGPVSRLALGRFATIVRVPYDDETITSALAQSLLAHTDKTFIPLVLGQDLASRIARYMQLKGYFLARLPGFLTIVYLEGADANGRPNADKLDGWNDRRIILRIGTGRRPVIDYNAQATTEPGRFYTEHPLTKAGAARIAFNQYKAWHVGNHHANLAPPRRHEALVQAGNITVHRDKNKDGLRTGDAVVVGSGMGINQHSGLNADPSSIGKMSAGCLVARSDDDHKAFMRLVKKDPRYAVASKGYLFMTTVVAGDDLAARVP